MYGNSICMCGICVCMCVHMCVCVCVCMCVGYLCDAAQPFPVPLIIFIEHKADRAVAMQAG